jgi:hypothetical protein
MFEITIVNADDRDKHTELELPTSIEKVRTAFERGVCQGSCRMGLKSFCKNSNGYIFQSQ